MLCKICEKETSVSLVTLKHFFFCDLCRKLLERCEEEIEIENIKVYSIYKKNAFITEIIDDIKFHNKFEKAVYFEAELKYFIRFILPKHKILIAPSKNSTARELLSFSDNVVKGDAMPKRVIIFTDTINTGKSVRDLIKLLKSKKIGVEAILTLVKS